MSLSQGMRTFMCLMLAITKGDIVSGQTGPNAVVLINGHTNLDCIVSSLGTSQWTRTTDGTSNLLLIAFGCSVTGDNAAYYRTEQPGGNTCRLIIANVTMQQAGVYLCFDGTSTSFRSLVTVIDPAASIAVYSQSEVVENDQLNISCSINYNGPASPAPSLRPSPYWTTSPEQIFTTTTYHPSTSVVTLVATVKVQKPTVPIFHCNTAFEITGDTTSYNPIPPSDNFTLLGATTQIDVQYPPSIPEIVATSSGFVACEAKNLTCYSDANPPPDYYWVDLTSGSVTNAQKIVAEYGVNYICNASNIIRNVVYVKSSIVYEASTANNTCTYSSTTTTYCTESNPPCSPSETAAIVLGILLAIAITTNIISLVLLYRKGAVNQRDSSEPQVAQTTSNLEVPHYQDLVKESLAKGSVYEELHQ